MSDKTQASKAPSTKTPVEDLAEMTDGATPGQVDELEPVAPAEPAPAVLIIPEILPEEGSEPEFNPVAGRSADMRRFSTALARAQGMVRNARKSRANTHFSSRYADLKEIADACRPALAANQISWEQVPRFTPEEIWLETILTHGPSGQYRIGKWPIPNGVRGNSQQLMAAFTYGRRGSLAMMVGVVSEDDNEDDDANSVPAGDQNQDRPPEPPRETKAQTAARVWADGAFRRIDRCKTPEELSAWENDPKRQEALVDLRRILPEMQEKVMAAIQAKHEALGGGEPDGG